MDGMIFYLDLAPREDDGDLERANRIIRALGEKRDGKGVLGSARKIEYIDLEDPAANAWKVEYIDFEDRAAALEALAIDLARIDPDWNDRLVIG